MNLEKEVFEIALKDIMPNRFQPREVFDDEALQELATSIKEHGVIQPIIVRKVGDKYEIIAGERRFRASQLADKKTIPALVRDMDDKEAAKIALLENLQRKDLTAIEEARTYETILKLDNITQEELAANLGKSQSTIANKLRLLNLDESVQTALLNEKISERHARSLLNLQNGDQQKELLEKVILNRMTVRELDEEIAKITGNFTSPTENQEEQTPINQPNMDIPDSLNTSINPYQQFNTNDKENITNVVPPISNTTQPPLTTQPVLEGLITNQPLEIDTPFVEQVPINLMNDNQQTQEQVKEEQVIPVVEEPKQFEQPPISNIFANLRVSNEPQITPINDIPNVNNNIIVDAPKVEQQDNFEINTNNNNNEFVINEPKIVPPTFVTNPFNNTPSIPVQQTPTKEQINSGIYDLRFAINNVRQAIQNTEKFGFSIETQEFDFDNIYQIIIKIDKNKTE